MKVIFLDFDGVLNSHAFFISRPPDSREEIDPYNVARLNRIVRATGAVVVVSSSWRIGRTLDELRKILSDRGFVGKVIDKTIDFLKDKKGNVMQRGDEISEWISRWKKEDIRKERLLDTFVVLDDDSDMDRIHPSLHIKTSLFEGGLLDEHADRAIGILGRLPSLEDVLKKAR